MLSYATFLCRISMQFLIMKQVKANGVGKAPVYGDVNF